MHCVDSSFLADYARKDSGARTKMESLRSRGEKLAVPSVALAEILVGANYRGGTELSRTLEFLDYIEVLAFTTDMAAEAGRIGAEGVARGKPIFGVDLLIAASSRLVRAILVTRDHVFGGVTGLAVESY
jgi:predicted nucleic acid-binding protein